MPPFTITYTEKCSCGQEIPIQRSFSETDQYPTLPGIKYCPNCNQLLVISFPPRGTIFTLTVEGIHFLMNDYLVNPKVRKQLYEQYQERLNEIKPILGGLIKKNKLTKKEEFEYELIKTNIRLFKERKERNQLTKEELEYLNNLSFVS